MLQWTSSGAVATPRTIQIRVQRSHPDRVAVGAPDATRSLSPQELLANIRFFTEGLKGPRTTPCTRLVLSGVGVARRPDLVDAVDLATELGIEEVILHASASDLSKQSRRLVRVSRMVLPIPLQSPDRERMQRSLREMKTPWIGLLRLSALPSAPLEVESLIDGVMESPPDELILSSPFPVDLQTPAPDVSKARLWLKAIEERLDPSSTPWRVQGLPACYLPEAHRRTRRAGNRWYVDSEHQLEEALRFFPDVMRFYKSEGCRFCVLDGRCDGFFEQWIGESQLPKLEPVTVTPRV